MFNPLAKLEKSTTTTARRLAMSLQRAIARIKLKMLEGVGPDAMESLDKIARAMTREYRRLAERMDETLKTHAETCAELGNGQAVAEIKDAGNSLPVEWSAERARRYWQYVAPENGPSLAAVFTNKMARDQIDALRSAVIETVRTASVEGWTAHRRQKELQARWAEIGGDDGAFKFVDRSGRKWENARYLQMLTRTTEQRVYNDALLDRLAEEGVRKVRIVSMGSPDCEVCKAWQGRVCRLTKDGDEPTVADARRAGVFHPNCLCTFEPVLEEERDAGKGNKEAVLTLDAFPDAEQRSPPEDDFVKSITPGKEILRRAAVFGAAGEPLPLQGTNPGFKNQGPGDIQSADNCVGCVVAGFLRLCGYNVVAKQTDAMSNGLASYTAWKNQDKRQIDIENFYENLNTEMRKFGDGSIAMLRLPLAPKDGHVVLASFRNESLCLYDPQVGNSGNAYSLAYNVISRYFEVKGTSKEWQVGRAWLLRLDNNVPSKIGLGLVGKGH